MVTAILIACSSSAPLLSPSEEHALKARNAGKEITLDELNKGHRLYVKKCGSCHYLYRPNKFTDEQWIRSMEDEIMIKKAKVNQEEKVLITRYLITMRQAYEDIPKK